MAEFGQHPIVQALAWTLAHFVWQGALVGLVATILFRFSNSAATRYAIGVGALVALLALPAATFLALIPPEATTRASSSADLQMALAVAPNGAHLGAGLSAIVSATDSWWPAAGVLVWFSGILVLSVRLLGGWVVARRMAHRAVRPAAAHIQALAADLAVRLALQRAVRVFESSSVAVPVLVGWLRPTVVFPIAALSGLSPAQVEALLAHELAHVRRHDYLVNLLQSVAEILLFYHPAVWWLSARVRAERELCCDDVAVGVCDRLVYATALTDLAAMMSPRVALAATGGDLIARVRRILGREETNMSAKFRWTSGVAVLAVLALAVPVLVASVRPSQGSAAVIPPVAKSAAQEAPREVAPEGRQPTEAVKALIEVAPEDELAQGAAAQEMRELAQQLERLARERELLVQDQARVVEFQDRARQIEIEAAKRDLERITKMFDVGLATAQQKYEAELNIARLQAGDDSKRLRELEVEATKRRLADAKVRAEIGVVSPDAVDELESALARLQAGDNMQQVLRVELENAKRQLQRSQALVERGLMAPIDTNGLKDKIALLEQKLEEAQVAKVKPDEAVKKDLVIERQKHRELAEAYLAKARDLQRFAEEQAKRREVRVREAVEKDRTVRVVPKVEKLTTEPVNRPIAAGDIVLITIEGESELPTVYRIREDGTIRVPLLGAFKVIGQTPAQVREAIGTRLSDSRLGSPAKVQVTLRGPVRR